MLNERERALESKLAAILEELHEKKLESIDVRLTRAEISILHRGMAAISAQEFQHRE